MSPAEFQFAVVKGIAKLVDLIREEPGISQRQILKRVDKRHLCLAHLHMACHQGHIVEERGLLGVKYWPEEYGPWL